MERLTKENVEKFCDNNFIDENVGETLHVLVNDYDEVYAEVDEKDSDNADLNVKIKLKSV